MEGPEIRTLDSAAGMADVASVFQRVWGTETPIVTVCRSGARSAQATILLRKVDFARVANLAGGMLRWRAQRFPVEGGQD